MLDRLTRLAILCFAAMTFPLQVSSLFLRGTKENAMSARNLLHILDTDHLDEDEVQVLFADGTTAVFESAELEKLRPRQKEMAEERRIA